MRTRTVAAAAGVLLAIVVPRAAQAPSLPPRVSEGRWSAIVDGLRGRLLLTAVAEGTRPQLRIDLELENMRDTLGPIEIPWREPPSTIVRFSFEDESGLVVSNVIPAGNEHSTVPYVLTIPRASATRMTLSPAAYEYLNDGHVRLRPFTFVAWEIAATPGRHYLSARLEPKAPDAKDPWPRPWVGPLVLQRVPLPGPEPVSRR